MVYLAAKMYELSSLPSRSIHSRLVHRCASSKIPLPPDIPRRHTVLWRHHPRVRLEHLAILSAVNVRLDNVRRRMEPPMESLERDPVRLFRDLVNFPRFVGVGAQWFLDQDVLSGLHAFDGPFGV